MADQQPVRLMNFISESKLEELKATRGAKVEDGTLAPERPLHEILRENKQKQEQEFKDRFKHRPPKALDDDEMEFLEKVEMMKREHARKVADEEAQELSNFEAAVASRTISRAEPQINTQQKSDMAGQTEQRRKRPSQSSILACVIKRKPQPKKAKLAVTEKSTGEQERATAESSKFERQKAKVETKPSNALAGLVAYDDDDEDD